jgi:hypothetical protein
MSTPVDVALPIIPVDELHTLLRHLDDPAVLARSGLIEMALVKRQQQTQPGLTPAAALHTVLTDSLDHLDPALADLLDGRFWEGLTVVEMLHQGRPEPQSERRFYEQQNRAIERFALLLAEQERLCRRQQAHHPLLARLPLPSYQQLFGQEQVVEQLIAYLHDPHRHPIISLKGIGGIGKTTVADYAIRQRLTTGAPLHDLVWISAKQEYLTGSGIVGARTGIRLEQLLDELGRKVGLEEVNRLPLAQKVERLAKTLRAAPYLVVLDNLESVEDFRLVAPWLAQLAGPTQFLLTARETVPALTGVTQVELGELTPGPALDLIQYTATHKRVNGFDPHDLYRLVGGNPLAILLVVSQLAHLPVGQVLAGVRRGSTADLYTYIYWNSWTILGEIEQELLFALQRSGDQADWDWLLMAAPWDEAALARALHHLIDLSLVQEQASGEGQRIYAIHRLTSTFLRTEVLGWK